MINFDWALVPGSLLCTVHLVLGLIIGYSACHFAKPEPPAAGQDIRQFKSAMDGLLTQVTQLSSLSQSHPAALPPAFLDAMARLIDSISAVQSQVSATGSTRPGKEAAVTTILRTDPPQLARPVAEGAELAPFDGLSAPLYEELTKGAGLAESEAGVWDARKPYHVLQYMAPWNGELPRPVAYQEVACNDLSSGGVSFFTKELPAEKMIVITLGPEHDLLMQAEIVHYQRRQQANSFVYYVGCRFTKRFENVPDESKPVRFEIVG